MGEHPGFVTNPTHQLKGTWTDSSPVPSDIVTLGGHRFAVQPPWSNAASGATGNGCVVSSP